MRKNPWGSWPSWVLVLFLIAYGLLSPMGWRLAITERWVRLSSFFSSSKADSSPSHPEMLDQWNSRLEREKRQALEGTKVISARPSSSSFRNVEQMQTLWGQAHLAQIVLHPQVARSGVIWIQTKHPSELHAAVTVGDLLIGYIDLVGKDLSRVRLLWDPSCQISVRTLRPKFLLQELLQDLDSWQQMCELMKTRESMAGVIERLQSLQTYLEDHALASRSPSSTYSSKGLLRGSEISWRSQKPLLKGVGFNYLQKDAYGPQEKGKEEKGPLQALVQVGDELVTSGLDGRFPPSLRVARVVKVEPQDSAGTLFQVQAIPLIDHIEDLRWVWVLPVVKATGPKAAEK